MKGCESICSRMLFDSLDNPEQRLAVMCKDPGQQSAALGAEGRDPNLFLEVVVCRRVGRLFYVGHNKISILGIAQIQLTHKVSVRVPFEISNKESS